ncbi:MAG: zinc-ribbon and DUF3426 domain-containing protein, partial [Xanthomonadaceae bacterium]|nr:zinc-ribbon and DUF3426 domain-containing protein [Xanthomonadaceae bacterium]
MFTRCDHCQAVLPLKVIDLAQAGGVVRCGSCGRTINALSSLFKNLPDEQSTPIESSGMPPLLQPRVAQEELVVDPERAGDAGRGPELHLDLEPEPSPLWLRAAWPLLAVVFAALLGLQLFGPPGWRAAVVFPGFGQPEPVTLEDALQLVSRDLHAHPSLSDAVVISAVVVNRSGQVVPWPNIDLKLF